MNNMQRVFSIMAVTSGTGTAAGAMTDTITIAAAIIGATCAVITTIAAVHYQRKSAALQLKEYNERHNDDPSED